MFKQFEAIWDRQKFVHATTYVGRGSIGNLRENNSYVEKGQFFSETTNGIKNIYKSSSLYNYNFINNQIELVRKWLK